MCKLLARWVLLLFLLFPIVASAQLESLENLEETTKKGFFKTYFKDVFKGFTDFGDPLVMSGGVGLNMRSYSAYNIVPRQDPFFYALNANLNVRIYKLNIPLSIMVTARNTDSSLPNIGELVDALKDDVRDNIKGQKARFIRFGMSPTYKWMKLHLGHRSMNFSKFTLANLNFFGAGTELTPGNWRFSAMYGRLAKAEPLDISLVTPNVPIYERVGWGAKLGYGTEQQSIDFMIFEAHDDANSISIPSENPDQPTPQENLTLGINAQKLFFERFRLKVELGLSAFSQNALDAESDSNPYPGFLFTERNTTEQNTALDAALDYEGEKFIAGVQVRRIDPNYKSLGAYFFNNDLLDLLGNVNFELLDQKLNVELSGGVQSNNLDLLKPTTTTRFIYSANLSYALEAFSASANYSNNTTDVGYVLNEELDSLNAVIITQDAGVNLTYSISDESKNQHVFTLGGNRQEVGDDIENPLESASSKMFVGHFMYSLMLGESKWKFSTRANYNQNELSQMTIKRYGGGFGVSKSFLKDKMNLGLDVNYFLNSNELSANSSNLNSQFRFGYKIGKGLSANLNLGLLQTSADNIDNYTELTGNLGLRYTFNVNPKEIKKRKAAKAKAAAEGEEDNSISKQAEEADSPQQTEKLTRKDSKKQEEELALKEAEEKLAQEQKRQEAEKQALAERQRLAEEEALRLEVAERIKQQELEAKEEQQKAESGVAELLRLQQGKTNRLEQERLAKEAAEKAQQERLDKEASQKAEQERLAKEAAASTPEQFGKFKITKATSLRAAAESSSRSMKRLSIGTEVTVLEKTSKYWWKVSCQGQEGYVKPLLLKR